MTHVRVVSGVAFLATAVLVGRFATFADPGADGEGGGLAGIVGPDVIVGSLPNIAKWGTVGGVTAYSVATTSCNVGDQQLDWVQGTNQHPVIPQNMYRLKDGRFEQIGMSWLKHGFCALQGTLCGSCSPAGPNCEAKLGVGCSDPYDANLNGNQSNLGPRSQVNPSTGFFTYPFTAPVPPATIGRRLQIANDDLNPALNPGALYFCEGMYVHPDDAAAENDNNNASYRQVLVGSFSAGGYILNTSGPTVQQVPALYAWQANDPDVEIVAVDVPADGRFLVGYRVTDLGDGQWRYEYAILNLNSNRAIDGFSLPMPGGVTPTSIGFRDIHHHSGEPYDTSDWTTSLAGSALAWNAVPAAENTNALRWGTLYNFRFDADAPPALATGTLDMFKSGGPATVTFSVLAPQAPCLPADFDCDGSIDGADLGALLAAWGTPDGDLNGDGTTDGADLGVLLSDWT